MQSKVGESSDVSEKLLPADSQFDFLLKVILFQTSILVLLIITIGVVVLLKFKNKEFLNIERGSSTRVEVADTDWNITIKYFTFILPVSNLSWIEF